MPGAVPAEPGADASAAPDADRRRPRFVADAMLGALARWLRILGLDATYDAGLDDRELAEVAVAEDRILLTRDRRLVRRRRIRERHLLIDSVDLAAQLRQVLGSFGLEPEPERLFSRCLRCNRRLDDLPADAARARVPAYVARTQERFRRCPGCDRVYWRGTHAERMRQRLERMLGAPGLTRTAPTSTAP